MTSLTPLLFFAMTLMEAGVGYILCLRWNLPFTMIPRWMLNLLPLNVVLLWLREVMGNQGDMFFFRRRGQGSFSYSRERGLAMQGDREEACTLLAKAVSKRGDAEALRLLLDIATEQPVMYAWISKGQVMRRKLRGMTREDHASVDALLSRVAKRSGAEQAWS